MENTSMHAIRVNIVFFRNAASLYGQNLAPATEHSVGLDLRACPANEQAILIPPGGRQSVPSGIAIEPCSTQIAGFIYSRSGLGAVQGLIVAQGVGVIDPDYRGEILVFLLNTSAEPRMVQPGERIAQLIFLPIVRPLFQYTNALGTTNRGGGGFGHTGLR